MRANTAPKYQDAPLTDEVQRKLILSFEECTSLPERQLKCPYFFSLLFLREPPKQTVWAALVIHSHFRQNKGGS